MESNIRSLRSYLMQRLLISIYLLWIVSTVVGYFATINYANQPYDLVLLQRANEVASELKLGSGHEQLDVVPSLPDGTELGVPDKVLYTVTDSEGRKLAGNGNTLRPLSYRRDRKGPLFSNGEREGQKTRMVSLTFNSNGHILQLHVSETTQQRQALIRGILANIVIPQLLLTLIALAVVWYGLKQGLRPLEKLRHDVVNRRRDDLSQLDGSKAPAEVRTLLRLCLQKDPKLRLHDAGDAMALWDATTGSMWRPEANRALSMALRSEGSDMASTRDFGSLVAMGSTVN